MCETVETQPAGNTDSKPSLCCWNHFSTHHQSHIPPIQHSSKVYFSTHFCLYPPSRYRYDFPSYFHPPPQIRVYRCISFNKYKYKTANKTRINICFCLIFRAPSTDSDRDNHAPCRVSDTAVMRISQKDNMFSISQKEYLKKNTSKKISQKYNISKNTTCPKETEIYLIHQNILVPSNKQNAQHLDQHQDEKI